MGFRVTSVKGYIFYLILCYFFYDLVYKFELLVLFSLGGSLRGCQPLSSCRLICHGEFLYLVIHITTLIFYTKLWAPHFLTFYEQVKAFLIEFFDKIDREPEYEPD